MNFKSYQMGQTPPKRLKTLIRRAENADCTDILSLKQKHIQNIHNTLDTLDNFISTYESWN